MSFFGKFKSGTTPGHSATASPTKKDPNAPQPTPLEKHLADAIGPVRPNGSDKFFGFENYGSTCYCNSIIQCLYYSASFREHVIEFPSKQFLENFKDAPPPSDTEDGSSNTSGAPLLSPTPSSTPYPNPSSPARKQATTLYPGSPQKPEEAKDSPEHKKKMAIQAGPVLDMIHDHSKKYGMDESLFTCLKDIFEAIIAHDSRIGVVSPHKFLEILRKENEMFRSAMHQDAHEFLNLLLNQVVDNVELFSKQHPAPLSPHANGGVPEQGLALAPTTRGTDSNVSANGLDARWVHDIFEGLLTSETRCLTCENTSQRDEAFLDLSVDLSPNTSVTSCLRKFSEEEMLCERNKFHCDNCGGLQEAEKRMKIKRLPRVLALHLKRFKYTEDLQRLQKLFHRVVYPFHLRLFNTTDDAEDSDRLYELYAVVVHIGGGPYHGHYVSIIKTQDRGWLLFDDELVEPVDKSYVLNFFGGEPVPGVQDAKQLACAYVLFYQETTLEAVLKEQEAEGHPPVQHPVSVSDGETAKENHAPIINVLHPTLTVATPTREDPDHMEALAHSVTAPPMAASSMNSPGAEPHGSTYPPLTPTKSKKELKQESKDRKAAQKAEERAQALKRKENAEKRVEMLKKQEDDLHKAIEASKYTAADETAKGVNKPLPPMPPLPPQDEKPARSRFARHGSMSLMGKPKFLGGKDKEKEHPPMPQPPSLPPQQQQQQQQQQPNAGGREAELTALPAVVLSDERGKDSKEKKNRFTLGRKKSTLLA